MFLFFFWSTEPPFTPFLRVETCSDFSGGISGGVESALAAECHGRDFPVFRDTRATEPGFDHRVDCIRSLLLNPVGDAGEDAEGEIGNMFLCAARGAVAKGYVGVAPQKESGDLDGRNRSFAHASQPAITQRSTIPVDHRGQSARARGILPVDLDRFIGESGRLSRGATDGVGDDTPIAASQQKLRQPGDLKKEYVPGLSQLYRTAQFPGKTSGMGQIKNYQSLNQFGNNQRHRPS